MKVLFNVYLGIKFHEDHSNKKRIEGIMRAIAESNCQGRCLACDVAHDTKHPQWASDLMKRAFSNIDASHLVIIDATAKGVGIGIEAGYAFAKRIPIITIAEENANISATLCGISTVIGTYTTPRSLRELLSVSITEVLEAAPVS